MDYYYWTKVLKKILSFALTLLILFLICKMVVFYLPFLISFIIAIIIEPAIKFLMKHLKWTRKISSIFVMLIFLLVIIGMLVWGGITLFNEASKLLQNSDEYLQKIKQIIDNFTSNFSFLNKLPVELSNAIINSQNELLSSTSNWIVTILNKLKDWITNIPNLVISFFFGLIGLYFMCSDKIYMIDEIEHHLPENFTRKLFKNIREIIKSLGNYLKAQISLVSVSFVICLIGLTIYSWVRIKCIFSTFNSITE